MVRIRSHGTGTGTELDHVVVRDNASAGVRISATTGLNVRHLLASGNREGLLVLDSRGGQLVDNTLTGNCAGLIALDTPDGAVTGSLLIAGNELSHNNRYCAGDDGPAESGIGVVLLGTSHVLLVANHITANVPSRTGADFSGVGLTIRDAAGITGGAAPVDNWIIGNRITANPVNIDYDGSGHGNRFIANR